MNEELETKESIKQMPCWMCREMRSSFSIERCDKCQNTRCIRCGGKLTVLRKIIKEGGIYGDTIKICNNKGCVIRVEPTGLKGSWKIMKDEETDRQGAKAGGLY